MRKSTPKTCFTEWRETFSSARRRILSATRPSSTKRRRRQWKKSRSFRARYKSCLPRRSTWQISSCSLPSSASTSLSRVNQTPDPKARIQNKPPEQKRSETQSKYPSTKTIRVSLSLYFITCTGPTRSQAKSRRKPLLRRARAARRPAQTNRRTFR